MRNQQQQKVPRRTSWKCMAVTASAAIAAMLGCVAPASVTAEVVVEQREMTAQLARLTHGGDLYNELCAVCHGVSGTGDGPAGPALKQQPIDLTVLTAGNNGVFPRESLEESIYGKNRINAHGTFDMPIWGRAFEFTKPDMSRLQRMQFARHRIDNIIDYIETLQVE